MKFKITLATESELKPSHKSLKDVIDLSLSKDKYITAEELAEQEAIPRESVLKFLDARNIRPIAKVINRGVKNSAYPYGKPLGGRPKLAFEPEAARAAILAGIEEMYGSD